MRLLNSFETKAGEFSMISSGTSIYVRSNVERVDLREVEEGGEFLSTNS